MLFDVLLTPGWDARTFKVKKAGQEFFGRCSIHSGKKNKPLSASTSMLLLVRPGETGRYRPDDDRQKRRVPRSR